MDTEKLKGWVAGAREYSAARWTALAGAVTVLVILGLSLLGGDSSEPQQVTREWQPEAPATMPLNRPAVVEPSTPVAASAPAAEPAVVAAAPEPAPEPLRPEPVKEAPQAVPEPAPLTPAMSAVPAGYFVQVGAFREHARATALAADYARGHAVHLAPRPNGLTGVWVGPYASKPLAERARDAMAREGKPKGFIVHN